MCAAVAPPYTITAAVSGETEDAFTVTWSNVVEFATSDVQISGGFATDLVAVSPASNTIAGLLPSTAYTVTVRALSAAGTVLATDTVVATTTAGFPPVTLPAGPIIVTCDSASSDSLTLSWAAEPVGTTQINFAITGVGDQNAGHDTSPIVYEGLAADTTYTVTAEARDTPGTVLGTDEIICSTTPAFPITATTTDGSVNFGWPLLTGATSYLYTVTLDGAPVSEVTVGAAVSAVQVALGNTDDEYDVTVQALAGVTVLAETTTTFSTWAANSATLTLTTPALPLGTWTANPTQISLTAPSVGSSSIAARMSDPGVAAVTSYRVFLMTFALPDAPTPAAPIYLTDPVNPPPTVGLYFGTVTPGAFPVTLNLDVLDDDTSYGILVHGVNDAGDVLAVGATQNTT